MKKFSRFIKLSGIFLVVVVTLTTASALFLPYLLDVNAYRDEIITALQKSIKRQVSFTSGSFAWHFGPSFRFQTFIVKEQNGVNDFISAGEITVKLALMPLLNKKVELKNIILDEVNIALSRNSDGKFNIDDLLKSNNSDVQVNLKKIRINNGTLQWKDSAGRKDLLTVNMQNISLTANNLGRGKTGHLKFSGNVPALSGPETHISINARLRLPDEKKSLIETDIDGDMALKQAEVGRFWSYFGNFIPFENTGGRLNFETSFKGKAQDFTAKGKILITGSKVNWPTVFHASLSPKMLQLDYKMALTKQLIDISAVEIGMEGFKIKGSFQLHDYLTKDPRIIAKASTPSTFRYEDVRNYVPYGIIPAGTSDYIENKIKSGVFKLDTGILDGRISQIAHMEIGQNHKTLFIRGPVEKAVLSYGPKAPAFTNLNGIVELKDKNFNLIGMSGNFGTSPFTLNGSITEYNTKNISSYPVNMNISPLAPEMGWLATIAGIPQLEYSNKSSLKLAGNGHYSAYNLNGDWDLSQTSYTLPGYVSKPSSMPHNLKFSTVIGANSTTVTSVAYTLQPLVITGSGLIGYGDKPYLGFDLQSNRFALNESATVLPMWQKYKIKGVVQAKIKGGGDPKDMSAIDYYGTVNLSKFTLTPDESLKQISDINGTLSFKGNSMGSSTITARYGDSAINFKTAIKSLKNPEGEFSVSAHQLYLRDLNLAKNQPDATIKRFNAQFTLKKNYLSLENISGLINSSNFNISGIFGTGSNPKANISITSSKLDFDDFRLLSTPTKKTDNKRPLEVNLSMDVETGTFGKIGFTKLTGSALKENNRINIHNLTAGVLGGRLIAKGEISADSERGDLYNLNLDISKIDSELLFAKFDIPREVTGTLALKGNIAAHGSTFSEFKKSANGNINLQMNNGKLRKFNTLSKIFSILNVSQLLRFKLPDMTSGGMPYSNIKGNFAVKNGIVSTQDLFISSNAMNMSIIGDADIVKEELKYTIGVQPLQTVDKIVNRIPIVGWLLTGKDKDLLTAYFEANGKWADPQVTAIPVKSMSRGLLNIFIRTFELPVKLFTDTGEVILGQ